MKTTNGQSTAFWHKRFIQQASWTQTIRNKFFSMTDIARADKILEVGSGTGVITKEISELGTTVAVGLDLDFDRLKFSRSYAPDCHVLVGDGLKLPMKNAGFDACVCHYLLLWVAEPLLAVQEMVRVTRKGGWVMALAEPDYGSRIDHPSVLEDLGRRQSASLEHQGADTRFGRRLMAIFLESGLVDIRAGVLGGQWSNDPARKDALEEEWSVLMSDIDGAVEPEELEAYRQAWFEEGRILYVPTFYAIGKVPES